MLNDQQSGVTEGSSQMNYWPVAQMSLGSLGGAESAESVERTMSGHDENVGALSYIINICM